MQAKTKIINESGFIFIMVIILVILTFENVIVYSSFNINGLFISLPISALVMTFYLYVLNFLSTIIIFDGKSIYRRGFFVGLKLKIDKENIKDVRKINIGRAQYYELYDDKHISYSLLNKNTSIKISCNAKGKKFIRLFWDGDIPD